MQLELYSLNFEKPIVSFEASVINLGPAVTARSGVWTFDARAMNGETVSAAELGLSLSSHLNSAFSYVTDTPPEGLMVLPKLTLKKPISALHIGYVPIFTKTPIKTEQFGALIFLTNDQLDGQLLQTINLVWPAESQF